MSGRMTKGERDELLKLVRHRERVLKTAASQRSAHMLAEFERQCATIHHFNKDETWKAAMEQVQAAVDDAQRVVADRCKDLGIPEEFAPSIAVQWYGRGENAFKSRQAELRRVAKTEIEAIEARARAEIERLSLDAQTQIIANGLQSEAAQAFFNQLPSIDKLMPQVEFAAVEQKITDRRKGGYLQ